MKSAMAAPAQSMDAKPLRNIAHPALVHLPLALLPLSVGFDVASFLFAQRELHLVPGAFLCILTGIVTGLLAAVFGILDYLDIRNDHPAKKTATLHLILNVVALGLFAVSGGLRYGALDAEHTPLAPFVVSAIALLVLGYSGYLGGTLVYGDGIAVGRHRRKTSLPRSTLTVRTAAGVVAIANDDALGEGETLRVELNGTVMCVARVEGRLHAVQEFCTHRYGPLSEGAIVGCEVMCPWHRSRFDLRDGKVAAGPAKIDLRTFKVESRDGKIWINVPARTG